MSLLKLRLSPVCSTAGLPGGGGAPGSGVNVRYGVPAAGGFGPGTGGALGTGRTGYGPGGYGPVPGAGYGPGGGYGAGYGTGLGAI